MERKISIKANYLWNTSYQILTLIVPVITAPYIARVLGADGTGIYSYSKSIVSYFTLVAILGTTLYGQRNIAYVKNSKEDLSRTFWELFLFRLTTSAISLFAYIIFLYRVDSNRIIFQILTIDIINVIVDISWFYQGIEDFRKIVIRNMIMKVFNTVFIFVFIKEPRQLWLYVLSTAGFTFLGNTSMWLHIPKYVSKPICSIKPFKHTKDIILLFLPTIAAQIYVVLDKSMIGWITASNYQNGCYEQAEKIVRIALSVVTSIATVVLPRVANLFKEGNLCEAKKYVYKGYRFSLMLSIPIMFGLVGVTKTFVPVFFGPGYDLVETLLPIFSVLVVSVSLAYVTGYSFLITTGQQNIYTISVTLSAVINLCMNYVLIRKYGAIGASVSSITAESFGTAFQIVYCVRSKQLELKEIFSTSWKYLASGFVMLITVLILRTFLFLNWLSLVVLIGVGAFIYFGLLFILRDKIVVSYVGRILKKLKMN